MIVLKEPKTAEYIHIDSENRVHLLLPIVGGDTVGLDNTCKTVLELQTFFYGKDGKDKRPSALKVLEDYVAKLEQDIKFLKELGDFPEDLSKKEERLVQIKGYQGILGILAPINYKFVNRLAQFPEFPWAIHEWLQKKTNCLAVHLSPEVPDYFLRTQSPVFTLNRPKPKKDYRGYYTRQPPVIGLGLSLREKLLTSFQKNSNNLSSSPKEKFIRDIVNHYGQTLPSLVDLQTYVKEAIRNQFSEEVDLSKSTSGSIINEDYFETLFMPYNELKTEEAVTTLLAATLDEQFWVDKKSIFSPDVKLILDVKLASKEVERISMATQFFLAGINIYCNAQGLSNENFGPVLDGSAEKISLRISDVIAAGGSVEDALFSIVNEEKALKLSRPLGVVY